MYANDSDKNVRYEIYQLCSIVPTLEREKGSNEDKYNWIQGEADILCNWASEQKMQSELDRCYMINPEAVNRDSEKTSEEGELRRVA